ncbi:hypothetical protein VF_A0878 [Aliivibrio fischeri ES114]|uniref:Uncharacterized protein n=1 Tax=Aliivibrio fischeri (strain ATCC 700601 / ES114) TaxID=312309 RepID=Q5DZ48_ALIF1|nr:hypothetical protein [Aliivibrio fischeri]AAW87948.1 hypothetical protein VF_A0878 [Aliivibrio fischeri ES114]KLU80432.1 hypothetical protein AB192_00980 [Aliivibrio fischeri]
MKKLILLLLIFSFNTYSMTCLESVSEDPHIRRELHEEAQKKAQEAMELRIGKKMTMPYVDSDGHRADLNLMIINIEENWCNEFSSLYSSYYNFYLANRYVFNKEKNLIHYYIFSGY